MSKTVKNAATVTVRAYSVVRADFIRKSNAMALSGWELAQAAAVAMTAKAEPFDKCATDEDRGTAMRKDLKTSADKATVSMAVKVAVAIHAGSLKVADYPSLRKAYESLPKAPKATNGGKRKGAAKTAETASKSDAKVDASAFVGTASAFMRNYVSGGKFDRANALKTIAALIDQAAEKIESNLK